MDLPTAFARPDEATSAKLRTRSPLVSALLALRQDRGALFGIALFLVLLCLAVFAHWIVPYSPTAVHIPDRLQSPSARHLLGTDELGRDLLSRLIYGARVSLSVGAIATLIASVAGIPLGLLAGYVGGAIDALIMRVLDGLLAFPSIILALAIVTALGPSVKDAMLAIGIVSIPAFGRITRATVMTLREREFVDAARVSGASTFYIARRVLLPNSLSPIFVQVTVSFADAILTEAALSFLGLGVPPPTPSWGSMLNDGRQYLDQTGWYSFTSGAAIFLAVLSLNLIGDGLRDALDPRHFARR